MSDTQNEQGEEPRRPLPPQHMSARVPDKVAAGVFSTGAIVMTSGHEFVIDFVQTLCRPHRVAARVVLPHNVLPQFIQALKTNLGLYTKNFGPPPALPRGPADAAPKRSAQEIYDDLKLSDDMLSGTYANGVMIGHTASEFSFDFLTNFFPHSSVACRVFVSSAQAPRLLESMKSTLAQFEERVRQQREAAGQPPPQEKEEEEGDDEGLIP